MTKIVAIGFIADVEGVQARSFGAPSPDGWDHSRLAVFDGPPLAIGEVPDEAEKVVLNMGHYPPSISADAYVENRCLIEVDVEEAP